MNCTNCQSELPLGAHICPVSYTHLVDNDFCKKMEDSLIVNLVQKVDTTGEAHLKPDGSIQFELQTKLIKRGEVKKVVMLTEMSSDCLLYTS